MRRIVLLSLVAWLAGARAGPASETSVPPRLEGVVIAGDPSRSVAVLRPAGARRGRAVRVGERAYGWTVLEIAEGAVLLEKAGRRVRLFVDAEPEPAPVPVARERTVDPPAHAGESEEPSMKTEWVRRRLGREEAEARLAKELPVILTETALTPRVEQGELRGLRILRLPDGTILSEVGLRPGDVLLSINDIPLEGLETLVELYPRLRQEKEIRVVVERSGELLRLAYDLR